MRPFSQSGEMMGEGGQHAVAVAFQMHEAGRRPLLGVLGVLDEAVERPSYRHQAPPLQGIRFGDAAGQNPVQDFTPALDAAGLQPCAEGEQIFEPRHALPNLPPGVLACPIHQCLLKQALSG